MSNVLVTGVLNISLCAPWEAEFEFPKIQVIVVIREIATTTRLQIIRLLATSSSHLGPYIFFPSLFLVLPF